MAGRMQEHMVLNRVLAPVGSPLAVVVVPPRHRGELLATDPTDPALLFPEQPQRPSAHQGHVQWSPATVPLTVTSPLDLPVSNRSLVR